MATINDTIKTERLKIRPLVYEDADELSILGSDNEVFKYIPDIETPFSSDKWVRKILENHENYIRHVIELKEMRSIIGFVIFNRRTNCDLQLGFWFGKKYWRLGYASEAVSAVLSLLKCLNVKDYIYAAVHPENIASIKILERYDFIKQNIANVNSGVKPPMRNYRLTLT